MSATVATNVRPDVTARRAAWAQFLNACRGGIARHFVRRAAVARLRKFDDRMLRDIGLERSEIEAAVYGALTRPGRPSKR